MFNHPLGGELGEEVWAFDVDVDQAVEALFSRVEDIGTDFRGDARVVYQHVQPAELRFREVDEFLRPVALAISAWQTSARMVFP